VCRSIGTAFGFALSEQHGTLDGTLVTSLSVPPEYRDAVAWR
jgi:hypothetical protein